MCLEVSQQFSEKGRGKPQQYQSGSGKDNALQGG
jgi:hypothetical protein